VGAVHPLVKIAIHQTSTVAGRAASVLLAEPRLEYLGVLDQDPGNADPRLVRIEDLSGWDVLISDTDTPSTILERAVTANIPLVLSAELPGTAPIPFIADAGLTMIARSLAHEYGPDVALVAATRSGDPLRKGDNVAFPPPVGPLRGLKRPDGLLIAPTGGDWGGVVVTGPHGSLGVSDHAEFLAAIALAAAGLILATSSRPAGSVPLEDVAGAYLDAAERAGLEVARFRKP